MIAFLSFIWEGIVLATFFVYVLVDSAIKALFNLLSIRKIVPIHGKTVVITGAAGGIGQALAHALYKEGCNLALLDINKAEMDQVAKEVRASQSSNNGQVMSYGCDVTNLEQVAQAFTSIRRDLGRVHILVNSVGIVLGKGILDESYPEVQRTISVNVMSYFLLLKEVLPNMISDGSGHIVALGSAVGLFGFGPQCVDYISSKFAVTGLMESLDYELHTKGIDSITLTTVCPFMVQTPLFAGCTPSRFTHFDPILSPEYVAASIVDGIKKKKRILILPPQFMFYVVLKMLLPRSVCFRLLDFIDANISMVRFHGRSHVTTTNQN